MCYTSVMDKLRKYWWIFPVVYVCVMLPVMWLAHLVDEVERRLR